MAITHRVYKVCNKDDYKICEGCKMYGIIVDLLGHKGEYRRLCMIDQPVLPSEIQCPCINCLVKGICEDECEEFRNYEILCKTSGG